VLLCCSCAHVNTFVRMPLPHESEFKGSVATEQKT